MYMYLQVFFSVLAIEFAVIKETVGTTLATTLQHTKECTDKLGRECFRYTDDQCVGKYAPWAREHCALRCGYCPQKLPCVDRITYCDEFDERICTEERYGEYMRENCRRTCNLCRAQTEYLTYPATVGTTVVSSWCFDNLTSASCWYYGDHQCIGIYESWARKFCPYRCGYCKGFLPPCEDVLSYCSNFDRSLCTNSSYAAYMRENCRKTCQFCTYPGQSLPPNSLPDNLVTPVSAINSHIPQTLG